MVLNQLLYFSETNWVRVTRYFDRTHLYCVRLSYPPWDQDPILKRHNPLISEARKVTGLMRYGKPGKPYLARWSPITVTFHNTRHFQIESINLLTPLRHGRSESKGSGSPVVTGARSLAGTDEWHHWVWSGASSPIVDWSPAFSAPLRWSTRGR